MHFDKSCSTLLQGKLLCKNVPYASLSGSWDADIALTADDVTEVVLFVVFVNHAFRICSFVTINRIYILFVSFTKYHLYETGLAWLQIS